MSNPLLLDYLFLRDVIAQRVSTTVPGIDTIEGIDEFAQASEAKIVGVKGYVLWEGDRWGGSDTSRASNGKSQIFTQRWSFMLAVRNAAQHDKGAKGLSAGPLLASIHKALAGWVPDGAYRPFVRTSGRAPTYRANVALYPLTFSIDLNL